MWNVYTDTTYSTAMTTATSTKHVAFPNYAAQEMPATSQLTLIVTATQYKLLTRMTSSISNHLSVHTRTTLLQAVGGTDITVCIASYFSRVLYEHEWCKRVTPINSLPLLLYYHTKVTWVDYSPVPAGGSPVLVYPCLFGISLHIVSPSLEHKLQQRVRAL